MFTTYNIGTEHGLLKIIIYKGVKTLKEIGEILKESRENNGVSIEEAAEDLNYKVSQLESIELGDFKNFKDIFVLKCMISDYAKYLGLNSEEIIDEFNEYVFESTSKIPIDDIEKASRMKEKEDKIASVSYTHLTLPTKA